jgi:hypothetical protein
MKIIIWLLKLTTNFGDGEWKAGQVKLGVDFSHFLWGLDAPDFNHLADG